MKSAIRRAVVPVLVLTGVVPLLLISHGSTQTSAASLPCVIVDGQSLGLGQTVTVCPHI